MPWYVILLLAAACIGAGVLLGLHFSKTLRPARRKDNTDELKTRPLPDVPLPDSRKGPMVIVGLSGELAGAEIPVTARLVLGRDPERCSVVFSHHAAGVSAIHCAVEPAVPGSVRVTDLGASCGTFINSDQLGSGLSRTLREGETFSLGSGGETFAVRLKA